MTRSVNGFLGTYDTLAAITLARNPGDYAGCSANIGTAAPYDKAWCDGNMWYVTTHTSNVYYVPNATGTGSIDTSNFSAALSSNASVIQFGVGTYIFNSAITKSVVNKTIRGVSKELTILKRANSSTFDNVIVSLAGASGCIIEDLTIDCNASNSSNTYCGFLKADTLANITTTFTLRNTNCINGRFNLLRLYPGSTDIRIHNNYFYNWEDVIFECTPWTYGKVYDNVFKDYKTAPTYASATGPAFMFYPGCNGWTINANTFLPAKVTVGEFTLEWISGGTSTGITISGNTFDARNALNGNYIGTGISGFISYSTIVGNTWANGRGGSIDTGVEINGDYNTITGNNFYDGQISLTGQGNSVVGNTFVTTRTAATSPVSSSESIACFGITDSLIANNVFRYPGSSSFGGWAIKHFSGTNSRNTYSGNTFYLSNDLTAGISFEFGTGDQNVITNNNIFKPNYGIYLIAGYTNTVVSNNIIVDGGGAGGSPIVDSGTATLKWNNRLSSTAPFNLSLSSSVTPVSNGDLAFQATSNTSLTFKYKGSDGTVRSGSVTLT